jgi:hypothetical protein
MKTSIKEREKKRRRRKREKIYTCMHKEAELAIPA